MPWREYSVMDERMKFVVRLLDGEAMSALCREYGISRKTGYKFWNRYRLNGAQAFADRSRRPYRYANQLPVQVEHTILKLKQEKPNWGAPKIRISPSRSWWCAPCGLGRRRRRSSGK